MKYLILSLLIIGIVVENQAQDFYDLGTIQTIEINFSQSNWDQLLDAEKAGDENYIMAESVTINGLMFDSVGVKYKGNSTYSANQVKNPFHIELDTYKEQEYQGYSDIKLSNVAKDPSFVREVLSYEILRKYMVAPQSNYANVYVNGNLMGLYSNSESISKTFVNDRFGSKSNTFVKCNPPDGAGPQASDFPDLVYQGSDSAAYVEAYELKSDKGWNDLIDLCQTLADDVDDIEEILNVDRTLWMLAYNNALVNLDSYIGGFKQNYYLYQDDHGLFNPIVWDLNESFGRFSRTGTGNLNGTTAKQQMSHLLNINDSDFPLVQKLLAIPQYKRMYLAHIKTILIENFANGHYLETGEALQALIDESVQADNNKFFTYANFQDNLTDDISGGGGPGGGATPGIANLMDGRSDYLLGQNDFTTVQPDISAIDVAPDQPLVGNAISITAEISNGHQALLGYRMEHNAPFQKVSMYDDGDHNDGAAGDGIFGVELMIDAPFVQYFIYAENDNIGRFSPERAAHEYHTLTATYSNAMNGDLVINEFMASNTSAVADQDGEYDDWLELYNNGDENIDLAGYFLSDDPEDLMQWEFPEGSTIAGGAYLTVWCDDDEDQEGLHANFKLSAAAESIFLVNPAGEIIDEVSFTDQVEDISYGRFPNGTGNFQSMDYTFGAENVGTTSTQETVLLPSSLSVYPNPASSELTVEIRQNLVTEQLRIYDFQGKLIFENSIVDKLHINLENWNSGIYLVTVGSLFEKIIIQ